MDTRAIARKQHGKFVLLLINSWHGRVSSQSRVCAWFFDEIILEVPDKTANNAAVILRETMIEAGTAFLFGVPVEGEITIGETWAEK
jgi:DNA polymerase I-like protein with 3'-5' exonuclease and polymerase domains